MRPIENWRIELAAGDKNQKKYLPGRLILTNTICYGNDVTQLYIKKRQKWFQIYRVEEKSNPLLYMDDIKISLKFVLALCHINHCGSFNAKSF